MIILDVKKGKGKAAGKHNVDLWVNNEEYVFLPRLYLILLSLNVDLHLNGVIAMLDAMHQFYMTIQTSIYIYVSILLMLLMMKPFRGKQEPKKQHVAKFRKPDTNDNTDVPS